MKFGEFLISRQHEAWTVYYLPYEKLKKILSAMSRSAKAASVGEPLASGTASALNSVVEADQQFTSALEEVLCQRQRQLFA